jgi:hypothetical protein
MAVDMTDIGNCVIVANGISTAEFLRVFYSFLRVKNRITFLFLGIECQKSVRNVSFNVAVNLLP